MVAGVVASVALGCIPLTLGFAALAVVAESAAAVLVADQMAAVSGRSHSDTVQHCSTDGPTCAIGVCVEIVAVVVVAVAPIGI